MPVVQKSIHHGFASRKLSLLEAARWWELRKKIGAVVDFCRIDPQSLDLFCDDLRQGYGSHSGPSLVFDSNVSEKQKKRVKSFVKRRPIMNREEFLHQAQGIVASLTVNDVDIHTDEVFLLVLHERDAILQVLLGDLKMLELRQKPTGNQRSLGQLMKFLADLEVVA